MRRINQVLLVACVGSPNNSAKRRRSSAEVSRRKAATSAPISNVMIVVLSLRCSESTREHTEHDRAAKLKAIRRGFSGFFPRIGPLRELIVGTNLTRKRDRVEKP